MVEINRKAFEASGLELVLGWGRFTEPRVVEVATEAGPRRVAGERIYLDLGTRAAIPPVPGLREAAPLTHVEALALDVLPARLLVVGGGYVGMELAGVELDARGFIRVDERLQTSAPGIWAMGEAAGSPVFTHVALDDYRVAKSGIAGGARTTAGRMVPCCVFIEPEFTRVGLSKAEACQAGIAYRLATLPMDVVPRARTLGERKGFMKALVAADSDRIVGFAMLGAQAGEVMAVVQMAMLGGLPFTALRDGILAHPTLAEGLNMLFATVGAAGEQPARRPVSADARMAAE